MSFQWTAIAAVLYFEIAWTVLLLVPIITPKRWKSIFQSNLGKSIGAYANYYFNIFMILLAVCFLDSIREMRKYNFSEKASDARSTQVGTIEHMNMKLFRAQRNFYIAGFALFLWFVLRKLINLIVMEANALENSEEALTNSVQAQEALEAKVKALNDQLNEERLRAEASGGEADVTDRDQELKEELDGLRKRLADTEQQFRMVQEQNAELIGEFDRLSADHQELQSKYNSLVEVGSGEKKCN